MEEKLVLKRSFFNLFITWNPFNKLQIRRKEKSEKKEKS